MGYKPIEISCSCLGLVLPSCHTRKPNTAASTAIACSSLHLLIKSSRHLKQLSVNSVQRETSFECCKRMNIFPHLIFISYVFLYICFSKDLSFCITIRQYYSPDPCAYGQPASHEDQVVSLPPIFFPTFFLNFFILNVLN